MTTNLRTGNILAALVLLGGLGACTTQAANQPEGAARDTALKACQTAANKATAALKSAP